MSIPSTEAKGLLAGGSSLIVAVAGRSEEALRGHRGLIKNYGGSGFDVSGIPVGIMAYSCIFYRKSIAVVAIVKDHIIARVKFRLYRFPFLGHLCLES